MTHAQIKHMVERFLSWRLPENFRPDNGIHFDADAAKKINPRNHRYEPTGTNLFDYTQAEAMVRHITEGLPTPPAEVTEAELTQALIDLEDTYGEMAASLLARFHITRREASHG